MVNSSGIRIQQSSQCKHWYFSIETDGVIQPRFDFIFDHLNSPDKADKLVLRCKQVQDEIDAAILHAQKSQAKFFNRNVKAMPEFQVGQQVMLNRKNISTTRPPQKLDYKSLDP